MAPLTEDTLASAAMAAAEDARDVCSSPPLLPSPLEANAARIALRCAASAKNDQSSMILVISARSDAAATGGAGAAALGSAGARAPLERTSARNRDSEGHSSRRRKR